MEPNWDEIRKCWVKLKLLSIHHSYIYIYMVPGTVWKFHMAMGTCSHWTFVRFPSPCLITDARDALGVAKIYSSNLDEDRTDDGPWSRSFRISQMIASWRLAQIAIPASMVGKSVSNGCERWFSESCIIFSCCSRNIWGFGRVESLPPHKHETMQLRHSLYLVHLSQFPFIHVVIAGRSRTGSVVGKQRLRVSSISSLKRKQYCKHPSYSNFEWMVLWDSVLLLLGVPTNFWWCNISHSSGLSPHEAQYAR